jgi:hypothetical protein
LRNFFSLPAHFLHEPGAPTPAVSDPATENGTTIHKGESYPIGARVTTIFGNAIVKGFRVSDSKYEVKFDFGIGHLNSAAILGTDELSPQALEALGLSGDGKVITINDRPVDVSDSASSQRVSPPCELFYGTQMCYLFVRLHHTLFTRLAAASNLADDVTAASAKDSSQNPHPMKRFDEDDVEAKEIAGIHKKLPLYNAFLSGLLALVDGSMESSRFEDFTRQLLGNKSYIVYTLDKVIAQLVKCLQSMANDQNVTRLIGLYMYHRTRGPPPVNPHHAPPPPKPTPVPLAGKLRP